jgi:hypothetical protein
MTSVVSLGKEYKTTPLLVSFYSGSFPSLAAFYDALIVVMKLVVLCCRRAADDVAKIKKIDNY